MLNGNPTVQQFGVGLAGAVILDATVVRPRRNPEVTLLPDRLRVEVRAWLDGHDVSRLFERGAR